MDLNPSKKLKKVTGTYVAMVLVFALTPGCAPATTPGPDAADANRWVSGALHVHSSYSDGAGSITDIAAAARQAGLDFVIVTDHWSLDALEAGEEGYHDGVLVLIGAEATTEVGHVLGLDLPPTPLRFGRRDAREVFEQIYDLGGFAIVAHPDGDRAAFRWTGWNLRGYEGLELFNAYSAYSRQGVARSLAYLFLDPYWQTDLWGWRPGWNDELISTWSSMLVDRRISVWAGDDAHGGIELTDGTFLLWPSYAEVFQMARNHLLIDMPLTGDPVTDRALIYDALRQGRGYVSINERQDGAGFRFWAERDGVSVPMGSDVPTPDAGDGWVLAASSPVGDAAIRLYRNGVVVAEGDGQLEYVSTGEGVWWTDARLRAATLAGRVDEPWIVSNPIAILPPEALAARAAANAVPPPAPLRVDREGVSAWPMRLVAQPNAGCRSVEVDPDAFGPASFTARFALGVPPRGTRDTMADPWGRCALLDVRAVRLTGYAGIRFEVRSGEIYRVSFVLSDGPDVRTASFLTSPDWQEVVIPFSRLKNVRTNRGGADLSGVSEMGFFFDTSNTIPGTSGEVEVRGIGLVSE